MSTNDPWYRDQSKLDYLPAFNDTTVARIDRISYAIAALVGLFGILYFSLANAAMTNDVAVSSVRLSDGYSCKMIASITRTVDIFTNSWRKGAISISESQAKVSDFNSQIADLPVSAALVPLILKNPRPDYVTRPWEFQIEIMSSDGNQLKYDNAKFDTHEDCLTAARAQTTCKMQGDKEFTNYPTTQGVWNSYDPNVCQTDLQCSSFNGKVFYSSAAPVYVNRTLLANPEIGKCNNQWNVSSCSDFNPKCQSLERFRAGYEERFRKNVFTPELLCMPFLENPPYICTKAVPPSVPSILSQSFAFTTTALAVMKTVLSFAVKMRHDYKAGKRGQPANAVTPVIDSSKSSATVEP